MRTENLRTVAPDYFVIKRICLYRGAIRVTNENYGTSLAIFPSGPNCIGLLYRRLKGIASYSKLSNKAQNFPLLQKTYIKPLST